MLHLDKPVAYLENKDFDAEGRLVARGIPKDKPVVVMLQSSWCPHCSSAKPAFQQFANAVQESVFCATVHADGDRPSEKALGKRVKQLKPNFRGFPDYVLYVNGNRIDREITGRDVPHLRDFSRP